ncbi:hypothetical protein SAMN04488541_10134 [Thermoflexibacter ruber]|uniref:Uncharacterized protein n=1 Tax=Thermoflexibacter ruber TaxID=1003 RepID=A0A1I2F9N1_9BACT|nr:hypothetical protein SAMN04488541_10134 [Thermoflexibacter ruber]
MVLSIPLMQATIIFHHLKSIILKSCLNFFIFNSQSIYFAGFFKKRYIHII